MIDVSDGLLSDTRHLLEESGVGAIIWEDRIPLSRSYRRDESTSIQKTLIRWRSPAEKITNSSLPHLLRREKKISSLSRSLKIPITCIGKILPKERKLTHRSRGWKDLFAFPLRI